MMARRARSRDVVDHRATATVVLAVIESLPVVMGLQFPPFPR